MRTAPNIGVLITELLDAPDRARDRLVGQIRQARAVAHEHPRQETPAETPPPGRSRTLAAKPLTRAERLSLVVYPDDIERPRTRGDCAEDERPCPFVTCAHHLYLDVNPDTGALKLNFPHLEVWEMSATCSLDVADRGGLTLDEVGRILNLTRERVRQIEASGLDRARRSGVELEQPPAATP